MSRRLALTALTGAIVCAAFGAPALADPVEEQSHEGVCLRLDPEGGRDGFCVWIELPE